MAADAEKQDPLSGHLGSPSPPEPDRHDSSGEESIAEPAQRDDEKSRISHESDDPAPLAEGLGAVVHTASRFRSRASSTPSQPLSIVPRSQRTGLFGSLTIIPEVERAYDYKHGTKWIITGIVALAAVAAPVGSSIFYPALPQMAVDLHASPTITNLSVALYMLSMAIFPLWWSSFSETLGRRTIYLVSFALFIVFSVLSAVSTNIAMLIVMRILAGGSAASVQAVGAGTIADIWEPIERGRAMGIFYLGPLMGPLLAPIIGGALTQGFGWESTMWFLAIYGVVTLVLILFCLPETLARVKAQRREQAAEPNTASRQLTRTSTTQSVQQRTKHVAELAKRFFIDPLHVLLMLRFPPVSLTVAYAAITFGSLFVLNISIQQAFSAPPYGFSSLVVGLLYLPPSLGYVTASQVGGRWIDHIMKREARRAGRFGADGKLVYLPEDRMGENAWVAASLFPGALVWYGWAVERGLPWIVPSVANFFFGVGSMLVFGAATTMLTEFMPRRSSGGIAVNNFVRNIFSCVGGVVTEPLIRAMGNGWLCTMFGLLAWFAGNVCIWMLKKNATKWRRDLDMKLNAK